MTKGVDRPIGVAVVAIGLGLIAGLEIAIRTVVLLGVFSGGFGPNESFVFLLAFLFWVAVAVAAYRIWYFLRWGHRLAQIVLALLVVQSLAAIALGEGESLDFFLLIYFVWALFYVSQPRIRVLYTGWPVGASKEPPEGSEKNADLRSRHDHFG